MNAEGPTMTCHCLRDAGYAPIRVEPLMASLKQCRAEMRQLARRLALSLAIILTIAFGTARAEDWPSFRGPTGMGLTQEADLPVEWAGPDDKNILWKAPLPATVKHGKPDQNQSSPIVWRDRVFVATAYWPA